MTWSYVAVVVVTAFMFTTNSVRSTKLASTTVHCFEAGITGQTTKLKCTISGKIRGGIHWYRPDGKQVVVCDAKHTMCVPTTEFIGMYSGVVDSPTQGTLTIKSFNPKTDVGPWSCRDAGSGDVQPCSKVTIPLVRAASGVRRLLPSFPELFVWTTVTSAICLQVTTSVYFT